MRTIMIPWLTERDIARFWEKVERRGANECWEWYLRGRTSHGYGKFFLRGSEFRAHRIAYFLDMESDPGDLYVCHECDNTACCNPAHLFAATQSVNLQDSVRKGRFKRNGLKGERHGRVKLSDSIVIEIRKRYASESLGHKRLAREYGVARSLINRIVRGIAWPHLPTIPVGDAVRKAKLTRKPQ